MAGGDGWRKGRWACEIFTRLTYVEWVVEAIIPIWKQTHLVKITLIHSPINTVEFLIPKKKFFALFSFLVVFIIFISRAVFIEKCFQFKKRVFFRGYLIRMELKLLQVVEQKVRRWKAKEGGKRNEVKWFFV